MSVNRIVALLCCLLLITAKATAQFVLVRNGAPAATILCADNSKETEEAAQLLNLFVERISGATLPVAHGSRAQKAVVIGGKSARVGENGFDITATRSGIVIRTGGGKGAVYGVGELLEQYLGVDYYAKNVYSLEKRKTITVPAFRTRQTPVFQYRQTNTYGNEDPVYRQFLRVDDPSEVFAGNLWVHTFNPIVPVQQYGASHPEYYAMIDGKRVVEPSSQWCLTNEELFQLVVHKVDSICRKHPGKSMLSVSQNDGVDRYCRCPKCNKVAEEEGAQSGAIIRFVNRLAQRFPDKTFSTLAFLYSMDPPKRTRPLKNVNIMLCSFDARRHNVITDNHYGKLFYNALEGWSAITDNIFLWDYGISFEHLLMPFPNFHILQPNMRIFREHGAKMLFSQCNGEPATDFAELRGYVLSKLMWNPERDLDSLVHKFMSGYYGAAGRYLYDYRKRLEQNLIQSEQPMWIADKPEYHKDGMFSADKMKVYNTLFDRAERAVASDETLLYRVQRARLTLQYVELELAKTYRQQRSPAIQQTLQRFRNVAKREKIVSIRERHESPEQYCNDYLKN